MKKICAVFISLFFLFSCSNDLDINADYKETPVIYGLLNPNEQVQYIQVFKGFLDENTSALVIAQNPDSIFYGDNVEVKLNDGSQDYILERILGPNRAAGVFVDSPNYVYRLPMAVSQDRLYSLTFTNPATGHVATAQTPIIKDFEIRYPREETEINFTSRSDINIDWRSAENGKVYQLDVHFFYKEWNANTPADVDTHTLIWTLFTQQVAGSTEGGEGMSFKVEGKSFYAFLKSRLNENSDLQREMLQPPLEFHFYVGGEELYNYIRVNTAQSGITALSVKPEYTNINGGIGVFSSRYHKVQGEVYLADVAADTLSCGSITKNLNFVDGTCD